MKARCGDPKHEKFPKYGGRGIRVCRRWLRSFEAFLADMGPKPSPKHTIDRKDHDGHYVPSNCWATLKEQNHNRRGLVWLTFGGTTLCVKEWAELLGVNMHVVYARIRKGWTPENALFTPVAFRKARSGALAAPGRPRAVRDGG